MKWPKTSICTIATDMQPGFAQRPRKDEEGVIQLRPYNVSTEGEIDLSTIKTVDPSENQIDRYSLRRGDILFNNTNSPELVGKTAYFDEPGAFVFSNHMTRVRVDERVADARFVARFLHWSWQAGRFRRMITRWVSQAAINQEKLAELTVNLPPPTEQRRIVELLDQADALRRQRRAADALAERVLSALFYQMFGDPATNPMGWEAAPIKKYVDLISGGTPPTRVEAFWNGAIPLMSPKEMGPLFLETSERHVSQKAVDSNETKVVPEGTILIVWRSGILAHTVPIGVTSRSMALNQDLKAVMPKEDVEIDTYYLLGWLLASKPGLDSCIKRGATVQSINTSRFESLPLMLPPPGEQQRFGRMFQTLLQIKDTRQSSARQLDDLFTLMLQRAFSGELTAAWREAHMEKLLQEMEAQAKHLGLPLPTETA